MKDYIKIPEKRVGEVIGEKGANKRLLESHGKCKLVITDNSVEIDSEDAYYLWAMRSVIRAIGRGFEARQALKLLKDTYELLVIDLDEANVRRSQHIRVKSRVIGEKGKAKATLETLTGSRISVFGSTVSAIVPNTSYDSLERAIMMIIGGARHSTVYSFLEKRRSEEKYNFIPPETL